MPEIPSKRSDIASPAKEPGTPEAQQSEDGRAKGVRRPALVAGLAALLLAGPVAGSVASPVATGADDTMAAFHAQFAGAFTPGAINLMEPCCSIKLPE